MSNNLDQLTDWLKNHKITEVECMIGDLTGITRGKISPTNKFIAEKGMRLPESVLLQTVTGDYVEDDIYYELLDPADIDMMCRPDENAVFLVPWAIEPTAQVIHDSYDKQGNPIEIGAVVIWHVEETAHAVFDVENYMDYVRVQSETAVRHLASAYAYDHGEEHEPTLRTNVDEVSVALANELRDRLARAGISIDEARLTHLAYAPEIAQAMLRRQQAEAVIAARQKIVHGAVSMVQMALHDLAEMNVVQLDEERKAAMVSNLLVVLCGESEVHPVVNTGTLYT